MKIIFTGGGTGGHIYPGIALIKRLRTLNPETEILYIGKKDSIEERICEDEQIAFEGVHVRAFYRKLIYKNVLTLTAFLSACHKVKKIIKAFKPDIVIGTGGYVSAPVIYESHRLKYPIIIHEQNSVPGMTNRFLSRYATRIAVSLQGSEREFPEGKAVLTGNPRAQEVRDTRFVSKQALGLHDTKKLLLIFTGSQGAKYVNEEIIRMLPRLAKRTDTEVIFVTGKTHYDNIIRETENLHLNHIEIRPYIDNMPELLKASDLCICRGGATTIAEITAAGVPAVIIPSPYVTNNHQEKNASQLVKNGAALLVKEAELPALYSAVTGLLDNPYKLQGIRLNCKSLGITDASDRFIRLIREVVST